MFSKDLFIRNFESDSYMENFLVSAVVSLFTIRIYLRLTHYPQIHRGDLHIAHLLWGGLFMFIALFILFSFISKNAVRAASIIGGIGFGFFIDELGKFITSNNDYFYQPTIALIYIIFVLIFLISRFVPRIRKYTKREYLVNAIEMIKESSINDFDVEEEKLAKNYLKKCDPTDPIVQALTKLMSRIETIPTPPPGIFTRLRRLFRKWYFKAGQSGLIINIIIIYLGLETLSTFTQSLIFYIIRPSLPFDQWGKLLSSILAGVFVLIGLFTIKFSREDAYRFFRIAMLITILLTEFFAFMSSHWTELINLGANVLIFLIINYAMIMEKYKTAKD